MHKNISDSRVVITSLIVSVSDVVLNLVIALLTGSTVMLSQSLQGLSDLFTAATLLVGVKRSKRKADSKHQFGYGREVFFWVLMSGILMFLGTGGLSLYFGYQQFVEPGDVTYLPIAFAMLSFGLITNYYSFRQSVKRLKQTNFSASWWQQLKRSSIVETKATLLIDFLGTLAACLGLVALLILVLTGNNQFDGIGSMAIGLMMMLSAMFLISDVRDLIVGRSVGPKLAEEISRIAASAVGVISVLDLRTMYLGSGKLLVIIEVHMQDGLDTNQIEKITDNIKELVKENIPQVQRVQVEIETPDDELSV